MTKNQTLTFKIIVIVLMTALLVGALVYYNAIDKLSPSDFEQDGGDDGSTDNGNNGSPDFVLPGNQPGNRCPTYDLRNVFGGGTTNTESLKGKVVVINFWYTTCGPCVAELPYFNQIASTYSDNVAVIIVHAAFDEDTTDDYLLTNYPDTKMIAVFDDKVPNQSDYYYKKLGGKGTYPMTVILDKDGIVTHNVKTSIHSYEELDGYVQTALSK